MPYFMGDSCWCSNTSVTLQSVTLPFNTHTHRIIRRLFVSVVDFKSEFRIWKWRPAPPAIIATTASQQALAQRGQVDLTHSPWFCPTHLPCSHIVTSQRTTSSVSPMSETFHTFLLFLILFFFFLSSVLTASRSSLPSPSSHTHEFPPCYIRQLLLILCLTSQTAFSVSSFLHLRCPVHCSPLRTNADKEANVDEIMLRLYFCIEERGQEVGIINWDLEVQLPAN